MTVSPKQIIPCWIKYTLIAISVLNIFSGALISTNPFMFLDLLGIDMPVYRPFFHIMGGMTILFGITAYFAQRNVFRRQALVLVVFLEKIFATIMLCFHIMALDITLNFVLFFLIKDFLWLFPLWNILTICYHQNKNSETPDSFDPLDSLLDEFAVQDGTSLRMLSQKKPVMLIFKRYLGCVFCREASLELSRVEKNIRTMGFDIVIVHMSDETVAGEYFRGMNLGHLFRVSDPGCKLYNNFNIGRSTFTGLIRPSIILAMLRCLIKGNSGYTISGDIFRLPGVGVVMDGTSVYSKKFDNIGILPNYFESVCEASECMKHEDEKQNRETTDKSDSPKKSGSNVIYHKFQ